MIRYLANGAIDDKFGRQGIIITDFNENGDFSTACLQQPDGKFVMVGSAGSQNFEMGFGIVRYLSDARFYYNTLKGSVFYDNNINGIKDAGEDFFSNAMVAARKTGVDTINITASTGRFSVDVDTGNYVIYPVQSASHVPYYITFPNTRTINHPTYFNTDSVSFAMQPIPGMRDLFVYIVPLVSARPGFTTDYMIVYGNKGTDTVPSGSVQFVPDNRVGVTSADPGPSSVSGDTMRWNYVNLLPHDTAFIFVHATIQPPPNVNIGDTLHSFASILPAGFDQDPKDNSFILHEDVIGSFDPNDKNENHAGQMSLDQLNAGEYLQYVIRFQNTGTDTAFNVYVRDTLANNLDWSTMEMLSASHSYGLVMNDGICVWTFNRIDLLAASQNEPASHGYIVFRIRPGSTFTIGNNINNTAAIYFDYNLPVITNTETTILVSIPVPVKLLSFNAKKNGKTHQLSWSTTNEINADRFEIERSANGIIFDKIGSVSTTVASTVIKNYSYTDALPLNGTSYYRLRIVDKDGRFEYGPVRILSNTAGDYFTIYPNPVRDDIYLKAESKHPAAWLIQVLSADGKMVSSDTWNVDGGMSVKAIKTKNLGAGTYFIKIIAAAGSSINGNTEPVSIKFNKL